MELEIAAFSYDMLSEMQLLFPVMLGKKLEAIFSKRRFWNFMENEKSIEEEYLLHIRWIFWELFSTPADAVKLDSTMDAMDKWDSLRHMALIAEIERRFSLKFKLSELRSLNSVTGIVRILIEKGAKFK